MKTYVISLKERSDRREKFSMPFDYEFLLQDKVTGVIGIDWSLSNIGCMLGHRQAIQLAKDKGLDEVLVLEDDAKLINNIPNKMPKAITFLGGDKHNGYIVGSHAVYYHSSAFDYLLKSLPTLEQLQKSKHPPMIDPYDVWLSRHGVGYSESFISFDEESGDIPHGGKIKQELLTA